MAYPLGKMKQAASAADWGRVSGSGWFSFPTSFQPVLEGKSEQCSRERQKVSTETVKNKNYFAHSVFFSTLTTHNSLGPCITIG